MEVVDGLAALVAHVEDQAIAPVADAGLPGNRCRCLKETAEEGAVLCRQLAGRGNVLLGDQEDVGRRARIDVVDGEEMVIFVDLRDGDLARGHATEEAVVVQGSLP